MSRVPQFILSDSLSISRVINGMWQIADMERDGRMLGQSEVLSSLRRYPENGLNTFDMADHYGSAEIFAGALRKDLADDDVQIDLLTKWVPDFEANSKRAVRAAVTRSLQRMKVEQLDLLQYHPWNYAHPLWIDHLIWLDELRHEGLIANLGLTNVDHHHLEMAIASHIPICSNQVSLSLLDLRAIKDMLKVCQKLDVGVLAFGTLAGGFLTDRWLGKADPTLEGLSTWSEMKYYRYIEQLGGWGHLQTLLQVLREVANQHSVDIAQIAVRFVLELPGVAAAIVGIRPGQREHIKDTIRLFDFELSHNATKELMEVASASMLPGHCGDEYRRPPFLTAKGDLSDHISAMPAPYPVETLPDGSQRCTSGVSWESLAGYSRAVKKGNRIMVSGTTATHEDRVIGGDDPGAQTHFVIDKIAGTLQSFGAELSDVVRTRIFIKNANDWESVARAHGDRFQHIRPANTLVVAPLIGSEYLVEMEAEAICTTT